MKICLLCLQINNNKLKVNIKVNSEQWQEYKVQYLIEKYFWSMQTAQQPEAFICTECWKRLNDFHKFYTQIEDAHMHFNSMMKIEISNENEVSSMQETQISEEIIEKQIIVKEECVDNLWEEDNVPSIELHMQVNDPLNKPKKLKPTKTKKSSKTKSRKEILPDSPLLRSNDNSNTDSDENTSENETTSINKNKERDKFIADNFKLICIHCQIPMETFRDLTNHFKKQHQEPGYAMCCNKQFFERRYLSEHIHLHLDPDYYKCKECDKIFADHTYLKNHRKIHDKNRERNFCCDTCGQGFFHLSTLEIHKTRHLTEEEKLFSCSKCDKKFGNKVTLSSHVRSMHTSSKKCDICGLVLVNKSAWRKHKILKHPVGEQKEYKCSICSLTAANQHNLDSHIKYAHQSEHKHKCKICDKAFKRPRSLKLHVNIHSDTPSFTCPWCPKTFKTDHNISTHHKKWHPKEYEKEKLKKYSGDTPIIKLAASKSNHSTSVPCGKNGEN